MFLSFFLQWQVVGTSKVYDRLSSDSFKHIGSSELCTGTPSICDTYSIKEKASSLLHLWQFLVSRFKVVGIHKIMIDEVRQTYAT